MGPTPAALRLKCWQVQLDCLADLCRDQGIELLKPPQQGLTPQGYLAPRYYAKDVTHANRRYGEFVLRQMLSWQRAGRAGGLTSLARAIVIGHSHCEAIAQAVAERPESYGAISVHRLQDKRLNERSISVGQACELAANASPEDRIFLSVLHGYHNLLGLVRSGAAFDFLLNPDDRPDPRAEIRVPHRAIVAPSTRNLQMSTRSAPS